MSINSDHHEKELLYRVARGEEAAFAQVYQDYRERFFGIAYKLTKSAHTSEDILQDVFAHLWQKRHLIGAAENPVGYLLKMFHHAVYYHFRKLAREQKMMHGVARDGEEAENPVEDLLLQKENREVLESMMATLSPQQQTVWRLRKIDGLSREEIAQRLGISVSTVKNHITAATQHLREQISKGSPALIWLFIWQHL